MPQIQISNVGVSLNPAPIDPDWILEGAPRARSRVISTSADGTALTWIWDCTAGVFTWIYDVDETVHLIEGSVTLTDAQGTRTAGAGDVVFFPAGSQATWRVHGYVRKLAFFRHPLPRPLGRIVRRWSRIRRGISGLAPKAAARPRGQPPQTV